MNFFAEVSDGGAEQISVQALQLFGFAIARRKRAPGVGRTRDHWDTPLESAIQTGLEVRIGLEIVSSCPRHSLRGFSFAAIGWITGAACCPSGIKESDDRQTPAAARDLRCRGRRRASRCRAVGASAPRAERPGDLSGRRQGRGRDGGSRGTALSRPAWTCSVTALGASPPPATAMACRRGGSR